MPGVPDLYQGRSFGIFPWSTPTTAGRSILRAVYPPLASVETPDWPSLGQDRPGGHSKLAWTRHSSGCGPKWPDVFTYGDYQPLQVTGPHRDHVIAFARRHGRDAAIVAVAKSFAPFTDGGRSWPRAEAFEGGIDIGGYSLKDGRGTLPLSELFPASACPVLRVKVQRAARSERKKREE